MAALGVGIGSFRGVDRCAGEDRCDRDQFYLATFIRTGVILVFGVGMLAFTGEGHGVWALGSRTWIFLVLSGLATGFSWLCYFRALQLGEASRVAPVDKLSVVFVLGLAGLFLGERLTWHQWLGGSLILIGAVVIAWKPV